MSQEGSVEIDIDIWKPVATDIVLDIAEIKPCRDDARQGTGLAITDVGSLDQCFFDCFPVEAGVFSASLANEAARRSFACFPILP